MKKRQCKEGNVSNENMDPDCVGNQLKWPFISKLDIDFHWITVEQMLVHFYAERMLFFRLSLREALKSIHGKH